jgi:hypothetical protein
VIDWLLVDYGEVLSRALPEATFTELAAIADLRSDEFREPYWRYRPDYDRARPRCATGRRFSTAT